MCWSPLDVERALRRLMTWCSSCDRLVLLAQDAPTIHISYHDGEHYNSVRMASDAGSGLPQPILLRERAASAEDWSAFGDAEVELVMQNTGCHDDRDAVQRALQDAKGNSDEVRSKVPKPYLCAVACLDLTELEHNVRTIKKADASNSRAAHWPQRCLQACSAL